MVEIMRGNKKDMFKVKKVSVHEKKNLFPLKMGN